MQKKCFLRDFKKLPNQNSFHIPMQTLKALFVATSKISINAHLLRICLKMGVKGMSCSSKLQVQKKCNDNVCNHCGVAQKDSSIIWSAGPAGNELLLHVTLVLVFSMRVTSDLDLYSFPLTKNVKLS